MKEINIGAKIAAKRKQRGVTQEELAEFLCVSKPAVSKWESGQSYPDITLLPVLATYFNTTVDELLGYEPQMSKEDIRKLHTKLCHAFATEPFETAYTKCNEYAKKYYSCWRLQFHIGLLFVNHVNLAGSPERMQNVLADAVRLFERVAQDGDDLSLARQAVTMQAYCYLAENKSALAIDLLDDMAEPPMSGKVLLAKAYYLKGDLQKAKSILQGHIYMNLLNIIGALGDYLVLYADNPAKAKDGYQRIIRMGEIFGVEEMHPSLYFTIYLVAAQMAVQRGDKGEAMDMLGKYADILSEKDVFPLELKGNDFFDSLDGLFDSFDLGTEVPRSDEVIKQSIKDAVLSNPAFAVLHEEARYRQLAQKLEQL